MTHDRTSCDHEHATCHHACACREAQFAALAAENERLREAGEAMRLIDELRVGEGDSVTILCDNPGDFDASFKVAIDCNGDWTNWQDRRFKGQTVLECFTDAAAARAALDGK